MSTESQYEKNVAGPCALTDIGAMKTESDLDSETLIVLEARLIAAASRADHPAGELRNIVCAFVDKMKSDGAPPEKVLIRVKAAVTAGKDVYQVYGAPGERERHLSQAVTWCIQRYYSATT